MRWESNPDLEALLYDDQEEKAPRASGCTTHTRCYWLAMIVASRPPRAHVTQERIGREDQRLVDKRYVEEGGMIDKSEIEG